MINLRSPRLVLPAEPCQVAHTDQSIGVETRTEVPVYTLVEIVLDFKRRLLTMAML